MKNIILLNVLLAFGLLEAGAQDQKDKQDTVKITLGNESITLPMPKTGNKVTVNLEDSTHVIQISIGKTSKFSTLNNNAPASNVRGKHVRWFNEIELGLVGMVDRARETSTDTGYGATFSTQYNDQMNRSTIIRITPEKPQIGFSLGFSIREKSRPIGNSNLDFVTGSRFRYSRYTVKGNYEIKEIKSEIVNGMIRYYPDSVYSYRAGDYRSITNSVQLLFPFMVEREFSEKKLKISAGVHLALNINTSKIIIGNGENLKTNYMITYTGPQIIQLQPALRCTYKRTSMLLSYNVSRSWIGFGATQRLTGRTLYFGAAYRLY